MTNEAIELSSDQNNIAETLAREMKAPMPIETGIEHLRRVALPPGWEVSEDDDERYLDQPRRKKATVVLDDAASFGDYVRRHGSLAYSTVWCKADYSAGQVAFTSIINDHGEEINEQAWRDHTARFSPKFSQEWKTWKGKDRQTLTQPEFAAFLEENLRDIASAEGLPTGAQMLEMALSFEANQDMRFKSAIRLQNGGVQMSFVQDDDDQTLAKMQLFDRFAIGIPVFWNGDAYRVEARLRYRARDGKLTFWYELIRPEKVLESATTTIIEQIRTATGCPFFFGNPNG